MLDVATQEELPITDQTVPMEGPTPPSAVQLEEGALLSEEAQKFVEIGDMVEYVRVGENGSVRQVQIVDGPDDPDRGIINDDKPLAIALLGCSVGERTTVEQPTSTIDIVVMQITKPVDPPKSPEPAQTASHGAAVQQDRSGATSGLPTTYVAWEGHHVPDPRDGDLLNVSQALYEIIEVEGPVLVARAFRLYARACGLQRLGRQVQANLNRALSRLVNDNKVIIENENRQFGQIHGIARVLGTERVFLRKRGSRSFDEIPPSEIVAHMRNIREDLVDPSNEELDRELLDRYNLVRMTQPVRETAGDHEEKPEAR